MQQQQQCLQQLQRVLLRPGRQLFDWGSAWHAALAAVATACKVCISTAVLPGYAAVAAITFARSSSPFGSFSYGHSSIQQAVWMDKQLQKHAVVVAAGVWCVCPRGLIQGKDTLLQ
jgi:hypothetical protein